MNPSSLLLIFVVGCVECFAYAAADELLSLAFSLFSSSHPGYALLIKFVRWLLQALFFALLGWQGMSVLLLGMNYTDARRGAALVDAVDSASQHVGGTPSRRGAAAAAAAAAAAGGSEAASLLAPPTPQPGGASASLVASPAASAPASAAVVAAAKAYAEVRRARVERGRLPRQSPEGETFHFAPCVRELQGAWADVMAAQLLNACVRAAPGEERLPPRQADPEAPPGVRAYKRKRAVQLTLAEHLTPELRSGVVFVSGIGLAVPSVIKLVETIWEIPDAQWACVHRELCPTDKVSGGWAKHRECGIYEAHPTEAGVTQWTGYLEVRIFHSRWLRYVTDMLIEKMQKHFKGKTLESLGHDGAEAGYCAKDVFRRICTPYVVPAEGVAAAT